MCLIQISKISASLWAPQLEFAQQLRERLRLHTKYSQRPGKVLVLAGNCPQRCVFHHLQAAADAWCFSAVACAAGLPRFTAVPAGVRVASSSSSLQKIIHANAWVCVRVLLVLRHRRYACECGNGCRSMSLQTLYIYLILEDFQTIGTDVS